MRLLLLVLLTIWTTVLSAAEPRTIKVSAMSEIKVAPDEALLHLAVHTRNEQLILAKTDNDRIAAAILDLVKKHRLPDNDVKVTDLDVAPDYGDYTRRTTNQKPLAYNFTRSLQVRVTHFKSIEPLLSEAFDAGLSHVKSLQFRVDQRKHQFEARKLAVFYAREKANDLAALNDMKLGSPISIEEGVEHNWEASGFGGAGISALDLPADEDQPVAAPDAQSEFVVLQETETPKTTTLPFAPGQITLSAQVTIEFELLPLKD